MVDLILRPSGLEEKHNKPWALQLRYHDCCGETEYHTLCRVSDETAIEIIHSGSPYWLFGEPDWEERYKKIQLEKARILKEEAERIEKENK